MGLSVAGAGGISGRQQRREAVDIQRGYPGDAQGQGRDMLHEVSAVHPTHQPLPITPRSAYGSPETKQSGRDPQAGGDLSHQHHVAQPADVAFDGRDPGLVQPDQFPQRLLGPAGGHSNPAEHGGEVIVDQRGGDRIVKIKARWQVPTRIRPDPQTGITPPPAPRPATQPRNVHSNPGCWSSSAHPPFCADAGGDRCAPLVPSRCDQLHRSDNT